MKISIDLNENIFKLFAYLMMSIVITVTVAVVLLFFIEYKTNIFKIENKNKPYIHQSINEGVSV